MSYLNNKAISPEPFYLCVHLTIAYFMTKTFVFHILCFLLFVNACQQNNSTKKEASNDEPKNRPAGMVWISAGEFTMGCKEENCTQDAMKPHRVKVEGFWMDETEVTNAQFKKL